MERQCWCRPISQRRLRLSLISLDTSKSYDNAEDDQWWSNSARMQINSNFIRKNSYGTSNEPQIGDVEFQEFDPDAIQIMEDIEFEQLPEAVNKEILKNSQKIFFEDEEEEISRKNLDQVHERRDKILRNNQEIIFEKDDKNMLMQNISNENLVIEKEDENSINDQEVVFDVKEEILKNLITPNKRRQEILRSNQLINFEGEKRDCLETNLIKSDTEGREIIEKNQEIICKERKEGSSEKNIGLKAEGKGTIALKKDERDLLTRKLEKNIIGLKMKNAEIHKEKDLFTDFPLIKVKEESKDIESVLQEARKKYKTQSKEIVKKNCVCEICLEKNSDVKDKICHVTPVNQDVKSMKRYFFLNENQRFPRKTRSCSNDIFVENDGRSFKIIEENVANQPIIQINQDQENLKKRIFSNEKQKCSRKFNKRKIDNSLIINEVKFSDSDPGEDAVSKKRIIRRKNCEDSIEERLRIDDSFPDKEQKSLKEFNKNLIHDLCTTNDRKLFTKSAENVINDVENIRILEEGRKSLKGSKKYRMMTFDPSKSNLSSCQLLDDHDTFEKWRNDDHPAKQNDNIRIENEKITKGSSSDYSAQITSQHKLRPNDFLPPVSPISLESGFYDENLSLSNLKYDKKGTHLIPRKRLEDIEDAKRNSSSS